MEDRERTATWPRVGGHLALDFVNTVGGTPSTADHDAIATYELLLLWSKQSGTITQSQARQLAQLARHLPSKAEHATKKAHALRRSLYVLLDGLRSGTDAVTQDWNDVRPHLLAAMRHAVPALEGARVGWAWSPSTDLATPLHPITVAAAELIASEDMALLRRCGRCRFLFLDRSRNHGRRWCNMRTCGFADKVERQAERRRATRDDT